MKKQYIKPEVNVVDILPVTMLAASNNGPSMDINPDEEVDGAANDRRGSWGNLWN